MARDIIRRCLFRPYQAGHGPIFTLTMWDLPTNTMGGRSYIGYRLMMRDHGAKSVVVFEGEDFGCSPMYAIDSDAAVDGLMSFLTLRPGDTDGEYFDKYTLGQLDFAVQHGEALRSCVDARFCDEEGRVRK